MSALHEVLAVEGSIEGRSTKLRTELLALFKKENPFKGKSRTFKLFDQSLENAVENAALEAKENVVQPLTTTVPTTLNYYAVLLAQWYDVVYQKEATNQLAKADVVLADGTILLQQVPVSMLLNLEHKLKDLRAAMDDIPTISPSKNWIPDPSASQAYVFKTLPEFNVKTTKGEEYKTVSPATDKHPAQVVKVEVTKNIGQYVDTDFTGMISPADKAMILDRVDEIARAVKKARQRANMTDVVSGKIGDTIMKNIFGEWYDPTKMNPDAKV